MSASKSKIEDQDLLEDIRHFVAQEGHHYKCHRRLNDILKSNGHPQFSKIEDELTAYYKKFATKSLRRRLAYCAGFEAMSNGFTTWLIRKRWALFKGASPHITSFWLMHMIEETEHKTVAHDAYMAACGGYWPRAVGVFHGSFHVLGIGLKGMFSALKKEAILHKPKTLLAILRELGAFAIHVGPFLIRATLPGYDPRNEVDPEWMREWVAGYAMHPVDEPLPLLDTSNPGMPMPFSKEAFA